MNSSSTATAHSDSRAGTRAAVFAQRQRLLSPISEHHARALDALPDETLIDGEIVGVDESGRSSFSSLENLDRTKAAAALPYLYQRGMPFGYTVCVCPRPHSLQRHVSSRAPNLAYSERDLSLNSRRIASAPQ